MAIRWKCALVIIEYLYKRDGQTNQGQLNETCVESRSVARVRIHFEPERQPWGRGLFGFFLPFPIRRLPPLESFVCVCVCVFTLFARSFRLGRADRQSD